MATSEHVFAACGTGHDSLPWTREAREAEAEAIYHQWSLAGKERTMAELLVEKGADMVVQIPTRRLIVLYWTVEDGYKVIV